MESFEIQFESLKFTYKTGILVVSGHFILNEDEENRMMMLIKEYIKNPDIKTHFYFKVHYLDGKKAEEQMTLIYQYLKPLNNLKIYWGFDIGDEGGKEMGEILKKDLGIPFEIKEFDFNE